MLRQGQNDLQLRYGPQHACQNPLDLLHICSVRVQEVCVWQNYKHLLPKRSQALELSVEHLN